MAFSVLVEATLSFIVFCADSVGDDTPRPVPQRLLRALCWPVTVTVWFTHRTAPKLARLGGIVWLAVTTGWLLSLERDRIRTGAVFLLVAQVTMAFVVYCVDAMSSELHGKPLRRLGRSLLWPRSVAGYLSGADSIQLVQASVAVWILLTTGWLLGLEADRIAQPLGWLAR
jgi:hypothetical protein